MSLTLSLDGLSLLVKLDLVSKKVIVVEGGNGALILLELYAQCFVLSLYCPCQLCYQGDYLAFGDNCRTYIMLQDLCVLPSLLYSL